MAINFTNLNELKMYIQAQINSVLKEEVVEAIKDEAIKQAKENVYPAYGMIGDGEPVIYHPQYDPDARRRYDDGGLIDRDNFEGTMPSDGTIEVRNIAKPAEWPNWDNKVSNLSELIEYGHGGSGGQYKYKKGKYTFGDFRQPRPFMGPAQEELASGNKLNNVIKEGLKRRGLTVK